MEFDVKKEELEQFKLIKSVLEGSKKQFDDAISVYDYANFGTRVRKYFSSTISDCKKKIKKETGIFISSVSLSKDDYENTNITIESKKDQIVYRYYNGDFYLVDSSHMLEGSYKVHYFLMTRGNRILKKMYHFLTLVSQYNNFSIQTKLNGFDEVKIWWCYKEYTYRIAVLKNVGRHFGEGSLGEQEEKRDKFEKFRFYLKVAMEDGIIFISDIPSVMRLLSNNEITFLKNLNIPKNILDPNILSLLEIEETIGIRQYFDQIVTDLLNEDIEKVKKIEKFMNGQ